jgi:hypothetical protein
MNHNSYVYAIYDSICNSPSQFPNYHNILYKTVYQQHTMSKTSHLRPFLALEMLSITQCYSALTKRNNVLNRFKTSI